MSEGKFEKSSIILNKLLKRFFKNKCPEIENLLAKSLMEMKDFDSAFKIIKGLMLRYPDNIYYKFNYALCLKQKAEEILLRGERKVRETEEAIRNLEKAQPIFDSLLNAKREINANNKNDREEKVLKNSEFFNKCNEILQFLYVTLINAKDTLIKDRSREQDILNKIEENRIRYNKMLESLKEDDEKQREEIKRKMLEDEKMAESFKEKVDKIMESKQKPLNQENKKGKKKKIEESEDRFIIDDVTKVKDYDSDFEQKKKRHKKNKKNKKRHRDEDDNLDNDSYIDFEKKEKKKKKKLRKKQRLDDENYLNNLKDEGLVQDEENMYQGQGQNIFATSEEPMKNNNDKNNNSDNFTDEDKDFKPNLLGDVEMKSFTKNELEDEELDFDDK
jgi:hypothetical protein